MRRDHDSLLGLYTIGIAMLFLVGFFLLVVFGAQSYRNTVAVRNDNMESRAVLSYLSTTIRGYDSEGAVHAEDTEYGQMLVVADGESGYGLKIYCYEGDLIEEYASLTAPLSPGHAQKIISNYLTMYHVCLTFGLTNHISAIRDRVHIFLYICAPCCVFNCCIGATIVICFVTSNKQCSYHCE